MRGCLSLNLKSLALEAYLSGDALPTSLATSSTLSQVMGAVIGTDLQLGTF